MAIGYYNFGNIQQGNQQVVQSLTGLGQSISNAIETHAATQSAQAMLPMLQQQYQSGMQKIASGDPNGIGDIYGAALTASQNPLLAPMAKSAIATAQSANINAQHMLRTQAYINARSQPKVLSPLDNARFAKMGRDAQINQINSYNSLYSGTKDSEGIGALAEKIRTAVDGGKTPEEADVRAFASKVSAYKQAQGAYGNQAIHSPEIESAYQEVQSQIPALQGLMKAEQAKGEGFLGMQFLGGTSPEKVGKMKAGIQQLQGIGGMPSAKGAQGGSVDHAALYQQAQDAIKRGKDPTAVMKRMKELGFDPNAYRYQIQGATQGGPQTSTSIPSGATIPQTTPESQDEAEAIASTSVENASD
jgi:hypothetical protein